jgi:hypothetical protein
MGSKEFEVTCPCCAARITVDAASGKVLRSREANSSAKADAWDSAQNNVRERTTRGADKLESALENERGKADRLDELFRKAQDKTRRPADDEPG